MVHTKDRNRMTATKASNTEPRVANGPAGRAQPTTTEERDRMISEAAYYRALQRGFNGGDMTADWLAAEREVDRLLLISPERWSAERSGEAIAEKTDTLAAASA